MTKLPKRLIAALFVVIPVVAQAAPQSACKGMSEISCGEAAGCSWINQYTRKDGRVVRGYCRTNSRKSAKSVEETKKPLDAVSLVDQDA